MPSSGIAGTIFYNADTDEQLNLVPVPPGEEFNLDNLVSNTKYRIYAKTVDRAGNLSVASSVYEFETLNSGPVLDPLSAEDAAGVDQIVNAVMHSGDHQTGVMVALETPRGSYKKAYGTAGTRPLTTDDHFRIGSVTKTFTAQAVFMECDKGNLSLDDTVDQYISGIPNGNVITIRNLLEMQSGLANDQVNLQFMIQLGLAPAGPWSPDNTLSYLKKTPAVKPPGTVWDYNSGNTILCGYILKQITGRSIRDIILEDIVTPLGMTETTWPTGTTIQAPFCHGYCNNFFSALSGTIPIISAILVALTGGQIVDITTLNPAFFDAAGAMTSTIGDLLKWGRELRDHTLISDEMHEERITISSVGPGSGIALGSVPPQDINYGLATFQVGSWFGHDGSIPGFSTSCMFNPRSGAVIVAMENFQTASIDAECKTFYNIARFLMPSSTNDPDYLLPQDIALQGIESSEAFGNFRSYIWAPPGDEDGKTDIPHKIPFVIGKSSGMPQTLYPVSITSEEAFGTPSIEPEITGTDQLVTLSGITSEQAFGSLGVNTFIPTAPVAFIASGTYNLPENATKIDYAALGAGAGGAGNSYQNGPGGRAGAWAIGTLIVGTDIKIGSSITITIGAGGAAGGWAAFGGNGGNTIITYTDPSDVVHTITAAGGLAGVAGGSFVGVGPNPISQTLNEQTYDAGASQTALTSPGSPGYVPGGGGAGSSTAGANAGGRGARGQAWLYAHQ
jgi:CubicO group peptidase (beta-lactamase class C family)